MSENLPESAELTASEMLRIQKQCDLARDENRIDSVDTKDTSKCAEWIERILGADQTKRFSNIECLGLGAYGLVFAVDDKQRLGKRVAVKVLRPSKANQRIPRERFDFEGQVLSGLKHPCLVELLETGQIDGVAYHIVELADCGSLATLLTRNPKRFLPRQAAWLISKIAEVLDEAHSFPVLHRDIKPGNILLKACDPLESEGLGVWPLLTDFGLSKKLDQSPVEPLTNYGEILGTLSYMSPEQVQGQAMRTPSDLFSLGVVLHELVHGIHPFVHRGHFQTLTNIVQSPAQKNDVSRATIPSNLDAIISKCLEKDPRARYHSASELSDDLKRFLRGDLISVATPTSWESFRALVVSHPKLAVFLGTLIASMLGFILVLSREWSVQRELTRVQKAMAKEQGELAEEKSKLSELFRQSMLGTNSEINDAILSGRRVSASELLKNLEQQFPILEQAHRLTPSDSKLITHLDVMSHYMSLCYFSEVSSSRPEDKQAILQKARDARAKSLEYIDLLIARNPDKEDLSIARINGLYNMSLLFGHDKDFSPSGLAWNSKAIRFAEDYMAKHPDDSIVLDTLLNTKYHRAALLLHAQESSREQIELYKNVVEATLNAYGKYPERMEFFILHLRALPEFGVLLWESGRDSEAEQVFESMDSLIANLKTTELEDWRVIDYLIDQYRLRCRVLFRKQYYQRVIDVTGRWEEFILASERQAYFDGQTNHGYSKSVMLFSLKYLRWLSVLGANPNSQEEAEAKRDAQAALRDGLEKEEFDINRVISEIRESGFPVEVIREWSEQ